uniref:WRKY domain-containing protein n=2 Tax=Rhizophora mucronata TaxID=61149 RepID=A0A2P2IWG1_RHIMU
MKRAADWEQKTLIDELTEGKALAKQLSRHINTASSLETSQSLLDKILSSYEKSLSMLNWVTFEAEQKPTFSISEAPHSIVNSGDPKDDASNKALKESKKRKAQPRWNEKVRIHSGPGLEGTFDDGYSWRKYGQKYILGSSFPRGYYRCTHRYSKGCSAMKQVQKSDEDPTIFDITYRGRHTCGQPSYPAAKSSPIPINTTSNRNEAQQQIDQERPKSSVDDATIAYGEQPEIESSKDFDTVKEHIFPSFAFTAIENENEEHNIFLDYLTENNFLDSLSPSFVSPATSESNYFSCHLNNFGMADNVHTPESELNDIISTPTSVTNSPIDDLDIYSMDLTANFPFDSPEFLLD